MRIFNIFCDASINLNKQIACSGAVVADDNVLKILSEEYMLQSNATNNSSEIFAVYLGVKAAIEYNYKYPGSLFRIFSDSKLSIFGLREWVFKWHKKIDSEGILFGSTNKPVSNQQYFIQIIRCILDYNLSIEFYHQKGHVANNQACLEKANNFFKEFNGISIEDLGLNISNICFMNHYVDNATREKLYSSYHYSKLSFEFDMPIFYILTKDDLVNYKDIINFN